MSGHNPIHMAMTGIRNSKLKKNITKFIIIASLIIIAALLRVPWSWKECIIASQSASILRSVIYLGLLTAWSVSIKQRIIQKQVRIFLLAISALMIFWLSIRTIKYLFLYNHPGFSRLFWYAYYIPMLLIPLMSMFVALSLGKPEQYRLPRSTGLLYIPATLLISLILTNDIHQLVFIIQEMDVQTGMNYRYNSGYWISYFWMLFFAFMTMLIIIKKSKLLRSRRTLWLPLIPFFTVIIYAVLYIIKFPLLEIIAGDMTVTFCVLIVATFEICMQTRLIKSNIGYRALFHATDIPVLISDYNYRVLYRTQSAYTFPKNIMRQAANAAVELDEFTRLSGAAISGGYVFWLENVSEIKRLLSELEEVGERLSENNDLLQAELELNKRRIRAYEKNRLYDKITKDISSQLQMLDALLIDQAMDTFSIRNKLVKVCIIGTYIKRRCNLLILSEDSCTLSAKELEYCFRESAEAISSSGIPCSFNCRVEGLLSAQLTVLIYDLFEEIVETVLLSMTALFINITVLNGCFEMKLQIECDSNITIKEVSKNLTAFKNIKSSIHEKWEDGTLHIKLYIDSEGIRS